MRILLERASVQAQHDLTGFQPEPVEQFLEHLAMLFGQGAEVAQMHPEHQPGIGVVAGAQMMQGVEGAQKTIEEEHVLRVPGMDVERLGFHRMTAAALNARVRAVGDHDAIARPHHGHLMRDQAKPRDAGAELALAVAETRLLT